MIYVKDFVTNSSSTSFVLLTNDKDNFTLEDFLSAAKIDGDGPIAFLYKKLYELIEDGVISEITSFEEIENKYRSFDGFSKDGEKEIKRRIKNGEKAYVGNIHDDSAIGAFFLLHKVVIVGDTFYFNWEPDAY